MSVTPAPRGTALRHWVASCLLAGPLPGHALPALPTREQPPEPFEEIELFRAGGATGILVVPPGAPDRQTPLVLALYDPLEPNGRAGLYTAQLLYERDGCAGLGVLPLLAMVGAPRRGLAKPHQGRQVTP